MNVKKPKLSRWLALENLETRLNLAGDAVSDACAFDVGQGAAARASHAVNCFASDLYEQFQREEHPDCSRCAIH